MYNSRVFLLITIQYGIIIIIMFGHYLHDLLHLLSGVDHLGHLAQICSV